MTCDIILAKNLIIHFKTKNFEIRHHFINNYIKKRDIEPYFIETSKYLIDMFKKLLEKRLIQLIF